MKCEEVLNSLSAYADKELDEKKRKTISSHLEECNSCKKAFKELIDLEKLFEDIPDLEPGLGFNAVIMGRIKEKIFISGKLIRNLAYSFVFFIFLIFGAYFYDIQGGYSMQDNRSDYCASGEILKGQDLSILSLDLDRIFYTGEISNEK